MSADVQSAFGPSSGDVRAANRLITWSVGVHILLVIGIGFGSRFWTSNPETRRVMTISLGGSPGVRSTGTNTLGGRTVEQVAPPPKRPEPVRPTPPEPPAPVQTRTTARPAAPRPTPPAQTQTRAISAARPPTTGSQVSQGSTTVETGVRSTASGLSFGGDGIGGAVNLDNFCCPDYLRGVLQTIDGFWRKNWPDRGITTLKFTIRRDGSIDLPNILVERSSGSGVLDRAAISALTSANGRILGLPSRYPEATLIVHLNFPYGQ